MFMHLLMYLKYRGLHIYLNVCMSDHPKSHLEKHVFHIYYAQHISNVLCFTSQEQDSRQMKPRINRRDPLNTHLESNNNKVGQ